MANYVLKDIATAEEFDLKIENGDIVIEQEPLALANLAAFRIMTEPGEWTFDPAAMLGLRRYLGGANTLELRERIKRDILLVLFKGLVFSHNDIVIDIFPGTESANTAIVIVEIKNINYIDSDGNERNNASVKSTYYMDTLTGKLTFIDDII